MISFILFVTSSKYWFPTKIAFSEGKNERSVMLEKENECVGYDEWTNEREIRDKYMIYIYILLFSFGISFVLIRHRNGRMRILDVAQGGVRGASDAVGSYGVLARIGRLICQVLKMSTWLFGPPVDRNPQAQEPTHTPHQAPSLRSGTHTTHWQGNAAYGAFQADCGVGAV